MSCLDESMICKWKIIAWTELVMCKFQTFNWIKLNVNYYTTGSCLYVEAREQLTHNLQFLDSLIIETLLFGDDSLSEEQNSQIFKSVQLYIKQTKRFNPQRSQFIYWIQLFSFVEFFSPLLFFPMNMSILYCYVKIYWTQYII